MPKHFGVSDEDFRQLMEQLHLLNANQKSLLQRQLRKLTVSESMSTLSEEELSFLQTVLSR
ncbi:MULTISPECIES: hypothetical protein [Vibrio]|uniref:Uncharacterized protein n=1 Tax=Vibrio campbellii TaxID=680 RepID=A0ACC7RHB7_9VIBR|nr:MULTISPECIES: hypothetical protein [Vibrio]EDL66837.1 hypothetical protein A1Q_2537 [Vibrio campbellii HY01]APX06931.1 hypothetical protein BWP24_12430 [Vibrio campbellii]ARR07141.1 hypothetical protein Vc3S01_2379 [Vibrio campbellii]ARR45153.1 hypothetical protein CAY59_12745 [Vibrio campbellii]AUV86843.1 hypothetical protein C1N50_12035 [Vibrio campbellii]|tara:strand:- start:463 stop:645 length:183 start_codon:yes stop_codon:yes gene_type:complete